MFSKVPTTSNARVEGLWRCNGFSVTPHAAFPCHGQKNAQNALAAVQEPPSTLQEPISELLLLSLLHSFVKLAAF